MNTMSQSGLFAASDGMPDGAITFGPFRLHPSQRRLEKDGARVEIGARALDLLLALVAHAPDVVGKETLLREAWPNVTVDEGSLRFHMSGLRRILDDSHPDPCYIVTVQGRGYCFVAPLSHSPVPGGSASATSAALCPGHGLPACKALVGRRDAVSNIAAWLTKNRFVSVVGPGGVGKTSVGIAVAHALLPTFEDAVWFVDLAPVRDPGLVANALLSAFGIVAHTANPLDALIGPLRDRRLLLVLDSCEHVIVAAAELAETLVRAAPQLHILATSREPLQAEAEHVYRLEPLAVPPAALIHDARKIMDFPALELFVERAAMARHHFRLDDEDVPGAVAICRMLDGIPLALELAAGRIEAYGVPGTADLLADHFGLSWRGRRTAPARHQTLSATFDWSHDLLSETERRVFRSLAAFAGVFTIQAARQVGRSGDMTEETVVEAVASLVAKSLVAATGAAGGRYRLFETTRAYAQQKLTEHGESTTVARRHAVYFRQQLAALHTQLADLETADALNRFSDMLSDIRVALTWSFSADGDFAIGAPLAADAAPFLFESARWTECRHWTSRALGSYETGGRDTSDEMRLCQYFGLALMFTKGASQTARTAFTRGAELAGTLEAHVSHVQLLGGLVILHHRTGDLRGALDLARQSGNVANRAADPHAIRLADWLLCYSHHLIGNQREATAHGEAARCSQPGGPQFDMGFGLCDHRIRALLGLSRALWLQGHATLSIASAHQTIEESRRLEHPVTLCVTLIWIVAVFLWSGDCDTAESLIAELKTVSKKHSFAPYLAVSLGLEGELQLRRKNLEAGISLLQECLAALNGEYRALSIEFESELAAALATAGRLAPATDLLDAASRTVKRQGGSFFMPELLRIKGELCLCDPATEDQADEMLAASIDLARSQSALSWELRTTMSLARRRSSQGRVDEAYDLLRSTLQRFTEGFDTADVCAAAGMFAGLTRRPSADELDRLAAE